MDVPTTRAFGYNKGVIATGKAVAVADVTASPTNATSGTYLTNRQPKARVPGNISDRSWHLAVLLPSFVGLLYSVT